MVATEELARRLRTARERAGRTQEQAAEAVGIPRTAIVKIESGDRAVSTFELVRLADLYSRDVRDLLADTFKEDPVEVLFRANPQIAVSQLSPHVSRCIGLCREMASLEEILGRRMTAFAKQPYDIPPARTVGDAIQQGKDVAAWERGRLGLGDAPAWELMDLIRNQGIRAAELDLPVSALSFTLQDEPIIIVNRNEPAARRLFSCAHEYGHRLMDRKVASVSSDEPVKSPMETRADVFAAYLLLPPKGVREFLHRLGKDAPAQVQLEDASQVAHYFGVSFQAAVYQLGNLEEITKSQRDAFFAQEDKAKALLRALGRPPQPNSPGKARPDSDASWDLSDQLVLLALEAFKKGEITKRKLQEVVRTAKPENADEALRNIEDVLATTT